MEEDLVFDLTDLVMGLALSIADFSPDEWTAIIRDMGMTLGEMRALAGAMLKQSQKEESGIPSTYPTCED